MGKVVVSSGNCKCWEYEEEIRKGVRYVVLEESRFVWFAGGEIKNEGVKFLQGGQKMRYKMFWKGGKEGQNGVGIVVREEWVGSIVRVMRASEKLTASKRALEDELVTFVSVYAPQVGRPQEEKDEFYDELYRFIGQLKGKYVVLGDMNGHVGRDMDGFEGVHGGNGFGDRNAEGEAILEFTMCFNLVANTFFTKETQKLVTYESGGVSSVVDYMLARKNDMKDVKVIPGEECVSQHKLVVMDMRIKGSTKKKAKGTRGKLKDMEAEICNKERRI